MQARGRRPHGEAQLHERVGQAVPLSQEKVGCVRRATNDKIGSVELTTIPFAIAMAVSSSSDSSSSERIGESILLSQFLVTRPSSDDDARCRPPITKELK